MPLPLVAAGIKALVATLASNGLGMLGNAILEKGKDVVEEKLGIKIPDDPAQLTPDLLYQLKVKEIEHEEFLIEAGIRREKMVFEADAEGQKQVTERWRFDMSSDSWLSKNVRPLTLVWWTIAITILILLDSALTAFAVPEKWISLIEISYSIVLGAYFVGRTVQHITKMRNGKNGKHESS